MYLEKMCDHDGAVPLEPDDGDRAVQAGRHHALPRHRDHGDGPRVCPHHGPALHHGAAVRVGLGVQPQLARLGPGDEDLVPELRGGDLAATGELWTCVNTCVYLHV